MKWFVRSTCPSLACIAILCSFAVCVSSQPQDAAAFAKVVTNAELSRLIGGDADCNGTKGQSTACTDTNPASCITGPTESCEPDPNNTTVCRQHVHHSYEKCNKGGGTSTSNWHCIPHEQTSGCVSCMQGVVMNGKCLESYCTVYSNCGNRLQQPESKVCKKE